MEKNTYKLLKKAKNGDETARNILLENNMGLVYSIAKKFLNRGVEFDDLVQIGSIGLFCAIDKFDETFGVMFSTYAVPLIMGEIKRFLRDNGPVKASRNYRNIAIKVSFFREKKIKESGREPTVSEISDALKIPQEEIVVALDAVLEPISLFESAYCDGDESILVMDQIKDTKNTDDCWLEEIALKEAIKCLKEREKRIIKLRYFSDKTQTEVAKVIGISQVQVSRLEKQILKKMRENIV